jgi:hypothetical protein
MERRWEFDALRGLMLVLMTVTHLPTVLSSPLGQPFGYVSAAEGFVLLSGFMAGLVYTGKARKRGGDHMQEAFLRRAATVYACQAALLVFLLTVVSVLAFVTGKQAITNLVSYYLDRPLAAWLGGLTLIYAPPLLDILPMYVLFLLISPVLVLHGLRQGWGLVLGTSLVVWLGAHFGLGAALYEGFAELTGVSVPLNQTGAFNLLAWQLLWAIGLWMGSARADGAPVVPSSFPRWLVTTALVIGVTGFVWRHVIGQVPFAGPLAAHSDLNVLFGKWDLGPLRLVSLFALMVLLLHFGDRLVRWLPRVRVLETLGAASLPVFCAHLVAVLLVLALVGEYRPGRPPWIDALLLAVTFGGLWATAHVTLAAGRGLTKRAERRRAAVSSGATRSPFARAGSPAD